MPTVRPKDFIRNKYTLLTIYFFRKHFLFTDIENTRVNQNMIMQMQVELDVARQQIARLNEQIQKTNQELSKFP